MIPDVCRRWHLYEEVYVHIVYTRCYDPKMHVDALYGIKLNCYAPCVFLRPWCQVPELIAMRKDNGHSLCFAAIKSQNLGLWEVVLECVRKGLEEPQVLACIQLEMIY